MKKVLVRRPGSFDKLEIVEAPRPELPPCSARVRTASIGVNLADCVVRMGLYPSAKDYVGWPITPGFEFSGVIEEVSSGPNPRQLAVGDAVFGVVRFGAYATELVAPLDQLFLVPKGLSLEQAGAIPVPALTAHYALMEQGGAGLGKVILVHSAAGGVGSQLVQMGKLLGCRVVGVVGASNKKPAVESLGADVVIDKSNENWLEGARRASPAGYDRVFDANGVETLRSSYSLVRPTGRLVIYGAHSMLTKGSGRRNWPKLAWDFVRTPRFDPLRLTNENKSVMAFNLSYLFDEKPLLQQSFLQICEWYAEGKLIPGTLSPYPFDRVADAHAMLQSGKTVGKLTLVPEGAMTESHP